MLGAGMTVRRALLLRAHRWGAVRGWHGGLVAPPEQRALSKKSKKYCGRAGGGIAKKASQGSNKEREASSPLTGYGGGGRKLPDSKSSNFVYCLYGMPASRWR